MRYDEILIIVKGSRNKPSWAGLGNDENDGAANDMMGSSDSLHQSTDFGQSQNNQSQDDLVSASVRPFNNNPSLPTTQRLESLFFSKERMIRCRDIVGNNLHFKSSAARNDWLEDENDQLAALLLYRDTLKRNLTTAAKAGGGLPK